MKGFILHRNMQHTDSLLSELASSRVAELKLLARDDRSRFIESLKALGLVKLGQRARFETALTEIVHLPPPSAIPSGSSPEVVTAPTAALPAPPGVDNAPTTAVGSRQNADQRTGVGALPLHRRITESASAADIPDANPASGARMYRVLHYPFVFARDEPNGKIVGKFRAGSMMKPVGDIENGWLPTRLGDETCWMLVRHSTRY